MNQTGVMRSLRNNSKAQTSAFDRSCFEQVGDERLAQPIVNVDQAEIVVEPYGLASYASPPPARYNTVQERSGEPQRTGTRGRARYGASLTVRLFAASMLGIVEMGEPPPG